MLLHGTGGTEDDMLGLGRLISPDAALLSPRGKVLENGMPRFFRRLAEGVFDEADLRYRADELASFVRAACETYRRDISHLIAVGFSNGANIAAAVLFTQPDTFGAAIMMRAMVPFSSATPPPLHGKSLLMLSAENDPIVPVTQTKELANHFRIADADLTLNWNAGGHGLLDADIAIAKQWIASLREQNR